MSIAHRSTAHRNSAFGKPFKSAGSSANLAASPRRQTDDVTDAAPNSRLPDPLPDDPLARLGSWLEEAAAQEVRRNPNSMTLATVSADGRPSSRVVLCKALDLEAGFVVLYTNYESRKCRDIEANPEVALTFHWDALGRQARIEGTAVRSPTTESDRYFASRARGSQIGAWGSDQSRPIASRDALVAQLEARALKFGERVPRPPHWGGLRIWARAVELWLEGPDRIHDRARWERDLTAIGSGESAAFAGSAWRGTRLQP